MLDSLLVVCWIFHLWFRYFFSIEFAQSAKLCYASEQCVCVCVCVCEFGCIIVSGSNYFIQCENLKI